MTTVPEIDQTITTVAPVLHRDSINPTVPSTQDEFVQSVEAFFDKISEMTVEELNTLIGQLNSFRVAVNAVSGEIEIASEEVEAAKEEVLTALATLAEGAIDNINIANNKAFSNQFILNELISTRTAKATLEDADNGLFSDSSDTDKMKKISWSNIKATLKTYFDAIYLLKDFLSLPNKITLIDTDNMILQETGGASKKVSWENIKATLKTYFDALYKPKTADIVLAYLGSNQSLSSGVIAKIQFGSEESDTNNWFDIANNRFLPNKAGFYDITATMTAIGTFSGTVALLQIYKNGVLLKRGGSITAAISSSIAVSGSAKVYLNGTTDYIEIYGQLTGANTILAGAANGTYFNANYIGE